MDKLKAWLKTHEEEMNADIPDAAVWQRIETNAAPKKINILSLTIRYVAAACIIGLAGLGVWFLQKENQQSLQPFDTVKNKFVLPPADADSGKNDHLIAKTESAPPVTQEKIQPISKQARPGVKSELASITNSYDGLINARLKKLRTTAVYAGNPGYFTGLVQHFKQMQKDEQALMHDMGQYGLTDELLEELININLRKLNALKVLQAEINKMNNKVRQDQEAPLNQKHYYLNI
jgi:hypothetical protein